MEILGRGSYSLWFFKAGFYCIQSSLDAGHSGDTIRLKDSFTTNNNKSNYNKSMYVFDNRSENSHIVTDSSMEMASTIQYRVESA